MIVQKKFKRLKNNAGFTLNSSDGPLALKISKTHYVLLLPYGVGSSPIKASKEELVWVDTEQIKPWWKL